MWDRGNIKRVKSIDVGDGKFSIPREIEEMGISNLPAKSLPPSLDLTPSSSRGISRCGRRIWKRQNKKPVKSNDINDVGFSIPTEIEEMVISNLPTKSLHRFQCVSKSWQHMTSDVSATLFQKYKKSNPSNYFIGTGGGRTFICMYPVIKLKNGQVEHEELVLDLGHDMRWCHMKCSYNGLVFLRAKYANGFYCILWNPSTQKWRKISYPVTGPDDHESMQGICYDQISGGFKIVLVFEKKLLVYSCKSSTWSSKDSNHYLLGTSSVSTEGAMYWVVVPFEDGRKIFLLKFDSKDDQLHLIPLPEFVEHRLDIYFKLSTLRDTLYVWTIYKEKGFMRLWVMNEDHSWKYLMDITPGRHKPPLRIRGIWFMNDGKDILISSTQLFTCNLANKVFTRFECPYSSDMIVPYVDCPVFQEIEGVRR